MNIFNFQIYTTILALWRKSPWKEVAGISVFSLESICFVFS